MGGARRSARSGELSACTIVSRNYLSHALILAESYVRHEPRGRFYLLVVDRLPAGVTLPDYIELIDPDDLGLPYFYEMCFKYDVTELSTAVKPAMLAHLLSARGEARIAYLDPDILVLRPMDEVRRALRRASIVLVPHLLEPIPLDGHRPNEQDVLIAGSYNLGFIALRRHADTEVLLEWWGERLRDLCRVSPSEGLMTDQRWIDLVPGMFISTEVLRDDTYDVAYWNLHSRRLDRRGGSFLVNGRPIAFFHFSGFKPTNVHTFSKHQDRFDVHEHPPLEELLRHYADLHEAHNYATSSTWEYGYSRFSNGVGVHPILRKLYLGLDDDARARFGDPFVTDGPSSFLRWATEPRGTQLSLFLASVYRLRYDVAAAFPDVDGEDRAAFLEWARTSGAREERYEPELVRTETDGPVITLNGHSVGPGDPASRLAALVGLESVPLPASENGAGAASEDGEVPVPGVNVIAYLRSESGLGAAARGYVRALRTDDMPMSLLDIGHLSVNRSEDPTITDIDGDPRHDVNLVVVNADEHFHVMSELGEDLFRTRYNIGVWAWELPTFPSEWHDRFRWYDEVWVGTSFIASALSEVAPMPVVVVPPVLSLDKFGSREQGRAHIGAVEDEFVFAFMFDFHSFFARKNPLALVEAFRLAFSPSDPARLVIKCVNEHVGASDFAALQASAQGHRIDIHAGYWPTEQVRDLMAACDAYTSLHRSEGTGMTMSDAMANGKPVIATNWSGNTDFMNASNSYPVDYELIEVDRDYGPYRAGQTWAAPSTVHASQLMRQVFEDREGALRRGERGRRDIEAHFSERRIADLVAARFEAIAERRERGTLSRRGGPAPVKGFPNYREHVAQVRAVVQARTPEGATVAVISRGDDAMLELHGREGWHFPRNGDGAYAGFYPKDSADAINHVEQLRAGGAGYLVVPACSSWWLEHYDGMREHLESRYQVVHDDPGTVTVFHLSRPRRADLSARVEELERALQATRNGTGVNGGVATLPGSAPLDPIVDGLDPLHREADVRAAELATQIDELESLAASLERRLQASFAWEGALGETMPAMLTRLRAAELAQGERLSKVEALAAAQARELKALRASIRRQNARTAREREQPARADATGPELARLAARFAARPYMARDAFGAQADLSQAMGYGPGTSGNGAGENYGFMDLFRGAEEFIAERQRPYLQFFADRARVLDLGCGRGEFMRLLKEEGVDVVGVEFDPELVSEGRVRGLEVVQGDCVEYLSAVPPGELDGIFCAQVVEHLRIEQLRELLALASDRLADGGVVAIETVNPESFEALKTFWVDPTHRHPIFPQVMLQLCREAGFARAQIFYPVGGGFTQRQYESAGEYAVIATVCRSRGKEAT